MMIHDQKTMITKTAWSIELTGMTLEEVTELRDIIAGAEASDLTARLYRRLHQIVQEMEA